MNGRYSPQRPNGESGEFGESPRGPLPVPVPEEDSTVSNSSTTARDRLRSGKDALAGWLSDFLVPKADLLVNPPGWPELTAYAYRGNWTKGARSPLRALAVLWLCTAGVFVIVKARAAEWLVHRPSRAVAFLIIAEMILRGTGDLGHGIADAIRTYFHALAWIFLP